MLHLIIPTYAGLDPKCPASLCVNRLGIPYKKYTTDGTYIYNNRNACLEASGVHNDDEYLFLDTDVWFFPGDVELLRTSGYEAISGLYPGRKQPIKDRFVAGMFGTKENPVPIENFLSVQSVVDKTEPFRVDWVGAGFLYVKGSALKKVKRNYFVHRNFISKDGTEQTLGEDIVFCQKLRDAGIDVYVHPLCILSHGYSNGIVSIKTEGQMAKISESVKIIIAGKNKKKIKVNETEFDQRIVELKILEQLFEIAANSEKKPIRINQLMDCMSRVENLSDDETELEISKEDAAVLSPAFEKTAGNRPQAWLRCRDLLDQIGKL